MLTLPYTTKKPEDGDKGDIFWDALAANAAQFDAHTHDGATSPKISSSGVNSTTSLIVAASWVAQGGGTYRVTVTLPSSLQYDNYFVNAKHTTLGFELFPTIEKLSATQFYVYVNDNALDLTLFYTS